MIRREPGCPPEQREQAAPAIDEVLLDDREDRGGDPVDEQARRQEPAVEQREQRQDQEDALLAVLDQALALAPEPPAGARSKAAQEARGLRAALRKNLSWCW